MDQTSPVEAAEEAALLLGAEAIGTGEDGQPVLLGSHCRSCDTQMVPPALVCPSCGSEDIVQRVQPRDGTLYSYSVLHVGSPRWRRPLALGYVDLDNGVRVFSHLEGTDWEIDQPVTLDVAEVGRESDGSPVTTFVFRAREKS